MTINFAREMEKNAHEATLLLKSMANETRLMILCQLNSNEMTVSQLLDSIDLSQSALSQHLAILRREKLVKTRRDAQNVYYSLHSEEVKALIKVLYQLYCDC
jgi:DNA-binding transcriptional ArsR family regulator